MKVETLLLVLLVLEVKSVDRNDPCTTPNNESAKCIAIRDCKVIVDAIATKDGRPLAIEFARKSQCGYDSKPLVCCGSSAYSKQPSDFTNAPTPENKGTDKDATESAILSDFNTKALPDRTVCGLEREKTRVIGGEVTDLDEFPWLAALEYQTKYSGENAGIRCGGSLIKNRYVLTAAHCILDNEFELIRAWLGDWNIKTDQDCREFAIRECAEEPLKLYLKDQVPHPCFICNSSNDKVYYQYFIQTTF